MSDAPMPHSPRSPLWRRAAKALGVLLAVLLLLVVILARGPIAFVLGGGLRLPEPQGPYGVGRATWDAVSTAQLEMFSDAPDDYRKIRVDVYYPAVKDKDARPGVYLDAAIAEAATGVPAIATRPITPNWIPDAPPDRSGAPYPVLVFSPGVDGPPVFYTSLLEHLASRGFIVLALWHPYTNAATLFADGSIAEAVYAGNEAMWEGEEVARDAAKRIVSRVWAEDMSLALDELAHRSESAPDFKALADFDKVGAFGHSFGGQNAAAVMTLDARFRAGLNMDGTTVFEPILTGEVKGPFALVFDEFGPPPQAWLDTKGMTEAQWWDFFCERNCAPALRESASPFYTFQIDGIKHEGFSIDLALLQPLFPFAITPDMVGTIDARESLALLADLIGGFFDKHLRGAEVPLLDNPASIHPALHRGIKGHPDPALARP